MKKRKIMTISMMVIILVNMFTITGFADYGYTSVTREMAWPEKGFNYKDILELIEQSNYAERAVGDFVFVHGEIVQITSVARDSKNRISSFDAIDKRGNTSTHSNTRNMDNYDKVTKIRPNLSSSDVNTLRTVTSSMEIGPFYRGDKIAVRSSSYSGYRLIDSYNEGEVIWYYDRNSGYTDKYGRTKTLGKRDSIIGEPYKPTNPSDDSITAEGWEMVHEYGLISTANINDNTYQTREIIYVPDFREQWTTNNSSKSDIYGPGILNLEITSYSRGAYNAVNYGKFGSYNPRVYEHKIVLLGDPKNYTLEAPSKEVISQREINIPVGKWFALRFANWSSNESHHFARIYRRYKGEAAAVQSVSIMQTGENSFSAVANVTNPGLPEADEHGHIWSSNTHNLTYELAPNKTNLGYRDTTGEYSSTITDCLPGVTYYTRPYITNELGISYGEIQTFKINTPPAVNIVGPVTDQFIHKGSHINIKADVSDGEGDNITYTIQIGTTAGSGNLYSGNPNVASTNILMMHSYDTSNLNLTWNATANRYEQAVYIRVIADDGKPGGVTTKDTYCIIGNYKPNITLTDLEKNNLNYGETLELTGKASDSFGGKLTISTSIGGKSTSTTINTSPTTQPASDNYSLIWQGSNMPDEGEYTNIVITVTDEHGGSNTVSLSKITITDILTMIKNRIQEHILLDSGSDLRFLIIDTDIKITESPRNNELLKQIRSMIKNRKTHLFFIGNDKETKSYIQRYLKDLN